MKMIKNALLAVALVSPAAALCGEGSFNFLNLFKSSPVVQEASTAVTVSSPAKAGVLSCFKTAVCNGVHFVLRQPNNLKDLVFTYPHVSSAVAVAALVGGYVYYKNCVQNKKPVKK